MNNSLNQQNDAYNDSKRGQTATNQGISGL